MFGIYRTMLALFVVVSHLVSITVIGQYAVHGFFILSGYLMTYIMINTYSYDLPGIRAFALNRVLRLYPGYWVLIIIMVPIIHAAGPSAAKVFNFSMGLPADFFGWLQNLSMIYPDVVPMRIAPRVSPPTWALTVEILFYACIGLGLSKTPMRTIVWFVVSFIYMVLTHVLDMDGRYRYSAVMAGSLPFAAGALLFHFRDRLTGLAPWLVTPVGVISLLVAFFTNCLCGCLVVLFGGGDGIGCVFYYVNLLLNFLVILALSKQGNLPISRKLDSAIGDYSYPIYLFHYPAGLAVSMMLFGEPRRGFHLDGVLVLLASLPLCILVSFVLIRFVDHPIQRIRSRVKEQKRIQATN